VRCTMPFMFLIYNNYMPHMRSSGTVYCVCVCSVGRCFFFVFFFLPVVFSRLSGGYGVPGTPSIQLSVQPLSGAVFYQESRLVGSFSSRCRVCAGSRHSMFQYEQLLSSK